MNVNAKWRRLGWRHPLWDYVRFFSVIQKRKKAVRLAWESKLKESNELQVDESHSVPLPAENTRLFFDYLDGRNADLEHAKNALRTEAEAVAFSTSLGAVVGTVKTKSTAHHQSSAAMVAAVSSIAARQCSQRRLTVALKPDRRCVWLIKENLHVTVRNLDGAIPSLVGPRVVWEIKEYWGPTKGGSKMSDAVYECNLVGRELREFEERAKANVSHIVFLDGKQQWGHRESDLRRFIDLFHQGIIDHLIIGKEVETEWAPLLDSLIGARRKG